ncbi:hypothetical protein Hanom_Chr05g00418801 [Helianthus anomalus]
MPRATPRAMADRISQLNGACQVGGLKCGTPTQRMYFVMSKNSTQTL